MLQRQIIYILFLDNKDLPKVFSTTFIMSLEAPLLTAKIKLSALYIRLKTITK